MGGMWAVMPRMGSMMIFFALASMGMPGIGNFIGEFLVLIGTYQVNAPAAVIASFGLALSTVYSLYMIRRVLFGPPAALHPFSSDLPKTDLSRKEIAVISPLIVLLLWIGLHPQPLINTVAVESGRKSISIKSIKKPEPLRIEKIFLDRQFGIKGDVQR